MKTPYFKTFLFIGLCIASICTTQAQTQGTRPNIIVILADDLGYGDVGFNRDSSFPTELGVIPTPKIDALANNGIICKNAHVAHPFCGPSRAALLTGMLPHRIGAQYNLPNDITTNLGIPTNEVYFSTLLKNAGYKTSAFGKWHLGFEEGKFQPLDRGFDYFFGFLGGGKNYFESYYEDNFYNGGNPITNEYQDPLWRQRGYVSETEFSDAENQDYLTDLLTDEAINYVNTNAPSSDPYFMYLAYNAPHTPLQAPASEIQNFKNNNPGFEDAVRNSAYMANANQVSDKKMEQEVRQNIGDAAYDAMTTQEQSDAIQAQRTAKIEEFTQARITYATMVSNMDYNIGRLIDVLDNDTAEFNNTVIIFLSDNGGYTYSKGAVNYPLDALKGSVKDGGHKVPMFVHWPNQITTPTTYNHNLSALDLYPTLVSLAGGTVPTEKVLDGVDFMDDLIAGADARPNENVLIMRPYDGFHNGGISMGQWKIVKTGNAGNWKLYNIINDSGETTDLRSSEANAEQIIQSMLDQAIDLVADFKDVKPAWFDNDGGGAGHPHSAEWDNGVLPGYDRLFESPLLLLESEINEITITGVTDATEDGTTGIFTVSLPNEILAEEDIIVNYALSGEAIEGSDYNSLTGTLTILNGTNSANINITAVPDTIDEISEKLTITLQSTSVGTINTTPADINIFDPIIPTHLTAGDIAIVGYKAASGNKGELAFVILKDINAGTSISISNRGWKSNGDFNTSGNGSPFGIDDVFSWTATDPHTTGTIFKLGSDGKVTTVISGVETEVGTTEQHLGTDGDWDLSPAGDSVLIYNGATATHPADGSIDWITGLNTNGIANAAGWAVGGGNSYCELPTPIIGLNIDVTGGDYTLNLADINHGTYIGNATGSVETVRTSINNYQNWDLNESNPYFLYNSNDTVNTNDGNIILGEITLSTNNPAKTDFSLKIFPNPTTDYININSQKNYNNIELELLTLNGKSIQKTFGSSSKKPRMDTSNLQSGMYLLRIKADNDLTIEKVIKL